MKSVRIYTMRDCPYCEKLRTLLEKEKIGYTEVDTDSNTGGKEFEKLQEVTKSDLLPTILVGKQAFVPSISFKTIDEAYFLIRNFVNKE